MRGSHIMDANLRPLHVVRCDSLPFPFRSVPDGSNVGITVRGHTFDPTALVNLMIRRGRRATYPRKSMAAVLRQQQLGLTAQEREALIDFAVEQMEAAGNAISISDWLTIPEAARALGVPPTEIQRMLATEEGRRQLGWPWRVLTEWRIPGAAIRSETRATYMTDLPADDPYQPVEE